MISLSSLPTWSEFSTAMVYCYFRPARSTCLLLLLVIAQISWQTSTVEEASTVQKYSDKKMFWQKCQKCDKASVWGPAAPQAAAEAFSQLLKMGKMWCWGPAAARKVPTLSPSRWCRQQAFGSRVTAPHWTRPLPDGSSGPTAGHSWAHQQGWWHLWENIF